MSNYHFIMISKKIFQKSLYSETWLFMFQQQSRIVLIIIDKLFVDTK